MNDRLVDINYRLYVPGGNTTALVAGIEPDEAKRREIQTYIMDKHREVEQVGFVAVCGDNPALLMTGGEFCGNAARSAAWYYLNGKPGEINLCVSGANRPIRAGVTDALEAWAEIPLDGCCVKPVAEGMYLVGMEGISHLVISAGASKKYLTEFFANNSAECLLRRASELLEIVDADLGACAARGVIFTERAAGETIKIHPCVFVKSAGTAIYETACGSGSAAVAILKSILNKKSVKLPILQPSDMTIKATATLSRCCLSSVIISGPLTEITQS